MRLAAGSRGHIRTGGRRTSGHTLVEISIALGVLMAAVLAHSQSVTSSLRSQRALEERKIALNAARDMIETMRSQPFVEVFQRYNRWDGDDGGLTGPAPGPDFEVDGLEPQAGQNFEGRIEFPDQMVGGALHLREDLDRPELGLPYSIDGDGLIDTADKTLTYRLLPVLVRIEWTGVSGDTELEVVAWLAD